MLTALGSSAAYVTSASLLGSCSNEPKPSATPVGPGSSAPTTPSTSIPLGPGPFASETELGQTGARLVSQCEFPEPFTRPLVIPAPLRPVRVSAGRDLYEVTVRPGEAEIVSGFTTRVWGYNGQFPGPLFETTRGRGASVRVRNELPVPIVRHLHGALTPSPSDGYPLDYVLPSAGWDHHLHMARTVHDGEFTYDYPLDQRAATLWYHDHRMDFSGPQVWLGLVGMHLHRDQEEAALGLPSGDRELPILICDRSFGPSGELLYPSRDPELVSPHGVIDDFSNGVLGDTVLVNGTWAPYHEVKQGSYRLRIVNASNARHYRLTIYPLPGAGEPFVQIGTDSGLMAAPVEVRSLLLAPAERVDVVIDFSQYTVGDVVTLTNVSGSDRTADLMQFRVVGPDDRLSWMPPTQLSEVPVLSPRQAARTRRFTFSRVPVAGGTEFHVGHETFDPDHVVADPKQGDIEIWEFRSDLAHPIHVHNVHFQILGDSGPPAWKDVVSLKANDTARVIARFDSYRGLYILHCHNLEHEDMGMMANFKIR